MGREWAHIDVVRDRAARGVVAFSNYWVVADEVHLLNLATHPEARRAGPRVAAARAHHRGRPRAQLPLRDARGSALERRGARLYRRFGFRAVGVRPNYYAEDQEDAIVMLLDLT